MKRSLRRLALASAGAVGVESSAMGSHRIGTLGPNVFARFSQLGMQHGSVNLGQGFPSYGTPEFVLEAASRSVLLGGMNNQYTRPGGSPALVQQLAAFYAPLLNRSSIDGLREICTYNGGQEGILCAMLALVDAGEEVVLVEPFFDAYVNAANLVGARVVGVPLEPPSSPHADAGAWKIDPAKLEAAITPKTRLLVLNTPQTFIGKSFTLAELQDIADVLQRHPQVIVVSDEVYEFMNYRSGSGGATPLDGSSPAPERQARIASLPEMYDRTISLFSAGKTFSCTGWRCGYTIAPPHLNDLLVKAHAANAFCAPAPLEMAVSAAFSEAQRIDYFDELADTLEAKRDRLMAHLSAAGLSPVAPQGGFFLLADYTDLLHRLSARHEGLDKICAALELAGAGYAVPSVEETPDHQFAEWMAEHGGVVAIPASPAFTEANRRIAAPYLRFAFCKTDEEIDEAGKRRWELAA